VRQADQRRCQTGEIARAAAAHVVKYKARQRPVQLKLPEMCTYAWRLGDRPAADRSQ
jgi:hypothetical protein